MVRMEPPCTDCHSFLWACHSRGSSSGYSLKPATNASFVFTGIMGSRTRVWPSFLFCGGIGFGKHQPPESYWSWPSPSSMLRSMARQRCGRKAKSTRSQLWLFRELWAPHSHSLLALPCLCAGPCERGVVLRECGVVKDRLDLTCLYLPWERESGMRSRDTALARHGSIKKATGLVLPLVDSASNSNARSYRPAAPSPCSHTRVMGGTARGASLGRLTRGRPHARRTALAMISQEQIGNAAFCRG